MGHFDHFGAKFCAVVFVISQLSHEGLADTQPVAGRSIRFPTGGQLTNWGQNIWPIRQQQQQQQQTRETRSGPFNFFNNLNLNRFNSRMGKIDNVNTAPVNTAGVSSSVIEKPSMTPPKWQSFGGNNLKNVEKFGKSSQETKISSSSSSSSASGLDPTLANQIQNFAHETKSMMARMDEQVPRNILNPFKYFVAAGNRLVRMWDETKRRNARDDSIRMPGTFDLLAFAVEQMKKLSDGEAFRSTDGVNESTPPSEALVQGLFMVKELTRRALRCDEGDYDDDFEEEPMSANEVRRRSLGQKQSGSGDKMTDDDDDGGGAATSGHGQKKRRQSQACKLLSARFQHIKTSLADS